MKTNLILAFAAIALSSCIQTPAHLSDLTSQYITMEDSVNIHYKVWDHHEPDAPKQTICFMHGQGGDMTNWEKQYEGLCDQKNLRMVFVNLPCMKHGEDSIAYNMSAVDQVLNALHVGPAILVGEGGSALAARRLMLGDHLLGMIDIEGDYSLASGMMDTIPLEIDVMALSAGNEAHKARVKSIFPMVDYVDLTEADEPSAQVNAKIKEYAARVLANGLEDYDFAIHELENNYAGFSFKVNDQNRNEWNRVKRELRDSVATGGYRVPEILSDLCCWFRDYHLRCTYRSSSKRFDFSIRDYAEDMKVYAPEALSARVDDDTWLLRFPTWYGDDAYCQWVSDAVEEYRQSGCENLVVDLRRNGGGNDGQYQPLRSLLYLQPGETDGLWMRNTTENRQRTREIVGDDEYWNGLMDKCDQDSSDYVQLFESGFIEQEVDPRRPKHTALIIDQRVGSSCEQLLLDLRAVAPDVKLYGKEHTMGCIDVSNVRPVHLPHAPNSLDVPVTVSQRLIDGRDMIDGVGMAPDVTIDLPYPDTLTNNIDAWVTWVAGEMKR